MFKEELMSNQDWQLAKAGGEGSCRATGVGVWWRCLGSPGEVGSRTQKEQEHEDGERNLFFKKRKREKTREKADGSVFTLRGAGCRSAGPEGLTHLHVTRSVPAQVCRSWLRVRSWDGGGGGGRAGSVLCQPIERIYEVQTARRYSGQSVSTYLHGLSMQEVKAWLLYL